MPTKRTPDTIKPEPPKEQPRQPAWRYASSGLARVHRLLSDASDEDKNFFEELMDKWEHEPDSLAETAFTEGARALGRWWMALGLKDSKEQNEDLRTADQILTHGDWLAHFLQRLFRSYRDDTRRAQKWTPEDVLFFFENEMDYFNGSIEEAQKVLKEHPDAIAAELQKLAEKRPDLFTGPAA